MIFYFVTILQSEVNTPFTIYSRKAIDNDHLLVTFAYVEQDVTFLQLKRLDLSFF